MTAQRVLMTASLAFAALFSGFAYAQDPPMFRSPSDLPPELVNEEESESYYYDTNSYYWDSPCRPVMYSLGGKVLASTTNSPDLYNVGGVFTLGFEWNPLYTCNYYDTPIVVSPIVNWDIGGMSTRNNMQMTDGPNFRESDGFFLSAIQPGIRIRKPLTNEANCYLQTGLDVRYSSTRFNSVAFDPIDEQVIVDEWKDDDWSAGYFAGGGIEYLWGPHIVRAGVNFESYSTRLMTGYKHQESQIAAVIELVHGR